MKFQADTFDFPAISSYGPGWVVLDGEKIAHSVVIGSRGLRLAWDCASFANLGAEHFELLARQAPELVIFGSGSRLRFPRPEWLASLMVGQIGIETMDTAAACRTYNILAGEGRHVVLALLLEPPLASPHTTA